MLQSFSFQLVDGIGVLGFLTFATAEILLALRKIHSDQLRFYALYATGSGLILIGLLLDFNLGAFLSESFSLMICAVAVAVRLRARPLAI